MRHLKHFSVILFAVTAIFVFAHEDSHKSLADLYRSGKVRFIQELVLDERSMPKGVFFESTGSIVEDKDGNIYISDYRANNIKKFDSSGKFLKIIGRKGQGPGEFNRPYLLTFAGVQLIVWDQGNKRLNALTPDGEYIKSINFSLSEGWPRQIDSLPGGDIVIEREKTYYGKPNNPQDCIIGIYSLNLEHKITIYSHKVWYNKFITEPIYTNVPQPFTPRVHWDVSPDGKIVIGFSEEYEIKIYDSKGDKISSFSHTYKPVTVTKEDKKDFLRNLAGVSTGGGIKRGAPDYIVNNTKFPKYKPAFNNLLIDSEGNILVSTYRRNKADEYRDFDAFDPEGNFIRNVKVVGEVPFPGTSLVCIVNNSFWLIELDEDGLARVIKYRISE